ncbi:MmcQ/YjbR family DNA-binding protein [Kribbella yunnanensis]|uniref:MmcQ/YjbR family DNA-binding protein n=1 Tax=Kribbella yunnanensis TaxID=190194 RepID=A0ABN2IGX7_9ACTN
MMEAYREEVVDLTDIRAATADLPRSYEVLVRDRIKFRVGSIVYLAVSPDEETIGIGFPREERAAALAAEPDKFLPPSKSDERFQWIVVRLAAIEYDELRELVIDAWSLCVPKKVRTEFLANL